MCKTSFPLCDLACQRDNHQKYMLNMDLNIDCLRFSHQYLAGNLQLLYCKYQNHLENANAPFYFYHIFHIPKLVTEIGPHYLEGL